MPLNKATGNMYPVGALRGFARVHLKKNLARLYREAE
jgi:hypothetical protein